MSCPLCQSEQEELFFQYASHTLVRCRPCDLIYQNNQERLDIPALIDEIYNADWVRMRSDYTHSAFLDHGLFNTLLMEMFCPRKGSLLEIGSGTGEFLYTAAGAGWQAEGVEPSERSCLYAREKYGLSLIQGIWRPDLPLRSAPYDAIAFWHVLEHIREPAAFLSELGGLLKPEGNLFMSVPNRYSFMNETYGPYSPLYTEHDHLFHYSERSLRLLLEQAGYTVVTLFSRQLPSGLDPLIRAHPGYKGPQGPHSFEAKMALLAHLQAMMRGHELVCVAKKSI